ncbi:MAG: radical SAM family heme chaperone HemW [Deltaproteobacteria bacterium]|nr:radical SAM family heme chaperone HemW [Deltaproteobacteria bacterium]
MTGLYIHIPFCRRKCPYCDFFSLAGSEERLPEYVLALGRHLELWAAAGTTRGPFATVFFGGGTPSLLKPEAVAALLETADRLFGLAPETEITLEANPGTLSWEKLRGYRSAGVNRLSLGIQSFQPRHLLFLGRIHGVGEIEESIGWARQAGFDNLGFDLMFGFHGQTVSDGRRDLERALAFAPEHLSLYGLTVEEKTPFGDRQQDGVPLTASEEEWAAMFLQADDFLGRHGFAHYEISNYARPNRECRHNQVYWRRLPYLGIGAGAHSFLDQGYGERWAAPPHLDHFFARLAASRNPSEKLEDFNRWEAMRETLYLGLRTAAGISETDFRARFGSGVGKAFPATIGRLSPHLHEREGRWRFSPEEWLIYDHLIRELF